MKILCDVCSREAAVVFCAADEAALCSGCDHRIHHANKLASRHPRLSILNPPMNFPGQSRCNPNCDICQDRGAVLFCLEDRAVICKECDDTLHTANEHARKHSRFLLTRVMLSPSAPLHTVPPIISDHPNRDMYIKHAAESNMACSPLCPEVNSLSYDNFLVDGGRYVGGSSMEGSGFLSETVPEETLHGPCYSKHVFECCSAPTASFSFTENDETLPQSAETRFEDHSAIPVLRHGTETWVPDAIAFELQYPTQFSPYPSTQ